MGQRRLLELAAYTLGVGLAVAVLLGWRLKYLYGAIGRFELEKTPLTVWLPISMMAALATYVLVLTNLVPRRFVLSTSLLLFGMAAVLAVVHYIFGDTGSVVSEILTPFVVHLVTLSLLLAGVRLFGWRLGRFAPSDQSTPTHHYWRFPVADLLLLSTALAVFLTVVHQFEYFWYQGRGTFPLFLWSMGLCLSVSSFATAWAALSRFWPACTAIALALAPSGAVAGWFAPSTVLFEYYWYGFVTTANACFLLLMLCILRANKYQLMSEA